MMPLITTSLLQYLPALLLFSGQAVSKHTHHHHHRIRQVAVAVPIASTTTTTPTPTIQATRMTSQASSEVISDLEDIQKGIDDLPGNLLSYIQSIEQRLETVESLLQSLLSHSAPTSSIVVALPSAPAIISTSSSHRRGPAPFTTPVLSSTRPAATSSSSSRSTTFRTSRITSTRTSFATITTQSPVSSAGASPRPYGSVLGNGTLAASPASGTGVNAMTRTVAVLPIPSTITVSRSTIGSAPTTFATLIRTAA